MGLITGGGWRASGMGIHWAQSILDLNMSLGISEFWHIDRIYTMQVHFITLPISRMD